MALWGGRFTQAADKRFKDFNDSLRFDYRLAEQDIEGSIGWSKALVNVGVLSAEEQQQLEVALNELLIEVRSNPQAILQDDAEDIHSWVESKLIDKVGNLGKKLLGIGLLSATAGAAVYYFTKKKEENPDLQEEFADFQDNLKETAASAVNVASKFKEVVEKSVDQAVNKTDELAKEFSEDDIFEDDFEDLAEDMAELKEDIKDTVEDTKKAAKNVTETVKETVKDCFCEKEDEENKNTSDEL